MKTSTPALEELRRRSPEHPMLDRLNAEMAEVRRKIEDGEIHTVSIRIGNIDMGPVDVSHLRKKTHD